MDASTSKSLGGVTFAWRNNDQDYHVCETLQCLVELCDQVVVAAGGQDGTFDEVMSLIHDMVFLHGVDSKWSAVKVIPITQEMWDSQQGREKLSYFSNLAIEQLTTDYFCYIQADEILHESSYKYVREAIDTGHESFLMRRLNLWNTPWQMLNVSQERKPVSTEVIRLAKTKYRCIGDAESIGVPECSVYGDIDLMQIYHTGFVRDKVKHLVKIKHMQEDVFLMGGYDDKAKNCQEFQPDRWFDPEKDLVPIPRPLPRFIQQWCSDRYPDVM